MKICDGCGVNDKDMVVELGNEIRTHHIINTIYIEFLSGLGNKVSKPFELCLNCQDKVSKKFREGAEELVRKGVRESDKIKGVQ